MTGLWPRLQSDEDQAYRSIEKLKKGEPLNPQAVAQVQQQAQQIMQMIQAGQPPDLDGDGMPDDPNEIMAQLQQQLEQAAVAPQPFEDYETHVNVLRRFMTSVEYEALDPQTQQRFVDRFSAMYDALMSLNAMQLEPPKVALQLKATTCRTGRSEDPRPRRHPDDAGRSRGAAARHMGHGRRDQAGGAGDRQHAPGRRGEGSGHRAEPGRARAEDGEGQPRAEPRSHAPTTRIRRTTTHEQSHAIDQSRARSTARGEGRADA
jgi:hypothetical protein